MNLLKVFDVAGSGMSAQSVRLNATASNLANLNTVSSTAEGAYRARHPVFEAALRGAGSEQSAGVRVAGVIESTVEPPRVHDPGHPQADDEGYVYHSNVDLGSEMVNMISASRAFQNNVELLNTTRDLMLRTLQMGN
jgi:flagellar basal-body rod protein FlgC